MKTLRFGVVVLALATTGCGLTLDYDPPDPVVGLDAGRRDGGRADGGVDAATAACGADADCGDGDVCNGVERCVEGQCVSGTPPVCDDSSDCTTVRCDPARGCVAEPDHGACGDDGVACTVERCAASGCVADLSHERCDDGIPCTEDLCDPDVPGGCRHEPRHERCGLAECDPDIGCVGVECATDAECFRGPCDATVACVGGRCERTPLPNGRACDDGNPCTATSSCSSGTCRGLEEASCPGQPCVRCNPAGGGCDGSRIALVGERCSDDSLCTTGDRCDDRGACTPSGIVLCPDLGPCRSNTCNPDTGTCESAPRSGPCDDTNRCTYDDRCEGGACVGVAVACGGTDPRPCVASSCDPVTGGCVTATVEDGVSCGGNAVCRRGECECQLGYDDCNGDGSCECLGVCGSVTGSRTCLPRVDCGACPEGQLCCPCTGACYDPRCLACCMGCG